MSSTTPLSAAAYTSKDNYELERRAVFSQKWLLTTHKMRFPETGNFIKYDIAGFPFIVVKGRDGNISAFHNVCRHRAFPVVTEELGTARIFSCKYHGWSYGLNGKLAKAPGYQDLDGFDKSQNGLFTIHLHTDDNGFVWVNLDGAEKPKFSWADDLKGNGLQSQFKNINFDDYHFDHNEDLEGSFNWKLVADSYNESQNTQSGATLTNLDTEEGLKNARTYYFPNASLTVAPHFFAMQRVVPMSATSTLVRYEIYRHKASSTQDFESATKTFKGIIFANQELYTSTQNNLSELDSTVEKAPLYFQSLVRGLVIDHQKREEEAKREIWPSRQTLPETAADSEMEIDFCDKLKTSKQAPSGCCGGTACQSGNASLVY
ncbi:hypothetical protein N7495_006700 [Penicillium taxi]|uniref:uncharacterized protein n=1 Tax=Penicillium taxi TaxID=168475 RepID=UPI002545A838|nr:uncharacterized protein N7495_006700 [Penicillium taxi]KAJ5895009.1 hypothetical protein N7495_006700 [Penicillium taxi]